MVIIVKDSLQTEGGRGVFAKENIDCFKYICSYTGTKKHSDELTALANSRNFLRKLTYVYSIIESEILDPTDDDGNILPEFTDTNGANLCEYAGIYINEPSVDQFPNCVFAVNSEKIEIWSVRNILEGEELLIFYGKGVYREYLLSQFLFGVSNFTLYFEHGQLSFVEIDSIRILVDNISGVSKELIFKQLPNHIKLIVEILFTCLDNLGFNKWKVQSEQLSSSE